MSSSSAAEAHSNMVNYCIRVWKEREREGIVMKKSANALLVDAQSSLITNGSKSTSEQHA